MNTYKISACNPFTINTYKTLNLKSFRINTYKKQGEGVPPASTLYPPTHRNRSRLFRNASLSWKGFHPAMPRPSRFIGARLGRLP